MIGVRYVSAAKNPSGYGEAARQFIAALFVAGVNLTCETISQMPEEGNFGIPGAIEKSLRDRPIDHKVNIIHLTPDLYPHYIEKHKYNIGHLFWETSTLPKEWIAPCRMLDEIWTASPQMAEMIQKSDVDTPCYTFSQPIDVSKSFETITAYQTQFPKDFIFYAIFQWIDRKNPHALLRAFWKEFEGNTNVTLLLKTYRITYVEQELAIIKSDITKWKKELQLSHYPKIYLVHKVLSEQQMWSLHKMGDVFINPSSGEGWNRPMQEAMLIGNPCISADNGGITDILTPSYYSVVKSKLVHATEQPWIPWYTSNMQWKEIDETDLRKQMRSVYEKRNTAMIKSAQQYVIDNFSWGKVGEQMKKRLERISKVIT